MRAYRRSHPLTVEQKRKDNVRSYANVYLARGKLKREPCCQRCGDPDTQKHHPDYDRPLFVLWFCRQCHLQLRRQAGAEA